MKGQDKKRQSRSYRDRPLRAGEIAARSKMYTTTLEKREKGRVIVAFDIPHTASSLRRRRIEKAPSLSASIGEWAVDTTVKELREFLQPPDAHLDEDVVSLRRQVLFALEKADEAVEPLRKQALEKERLRKALPNLDDLIHTIERDATAHALNGLPAALSYFGENPKRWASVLSALEQLPELRSLVAHVFKRQQRRGSLGTPFEDAFIRGLAEIWQKQTGNRPPKVVKQAKTRRSMGYMFPAFVERAFLDIGEPVRGLERRIRRVLGTSKS